MPNLQNQSSEALEQRTSLEGVELTSLASLHSRTTIDDNVNTSDQHESIISSTDALDRPLDTGYAGIASQSPPLESRDDTQECLSFPKDPRSRTAVQKIGLQTVVLLVATLVVTTVVIGFLTFLWTAPHDNSFWRTIVIKGWAGGAVTVSSLVLRTAIDFQAGVAVAMLAAILLETDFNLLFIDTAQVSKLRAGRAVPMDIAIPHIRAMRYKWVQSLGGYLQLSVVLLLVATTLLLQVTSTMLVSDLSLGVLPSASSNEDLPFDFTYEWNETDLEWAHPIQRRAAKPWLRNPPAFPTFAEFSEPIGVPEHVDETGHLLRAFLPFQDAQSRETISEYSGKALVLDARVSCQRPEIQQLYVDRNSSSMSLVGAFSKTHDVPGLLGPTTSIPFNCPYPDIFIKHFSIICQPSGLRHGDGKLMSELRDGKQWSTLAENWSNGSLSIDDRPNAAYLVFNNTIGSNDEASMNSTRDLSTTSGHGACFDVSHLSLTSGNFIYMNVSLTLCYPATWTARLDVALHSPYNRTEPSASSSDPMFHTTPDLHVQMGELKHEHEKSTLESRGILAMEAKDSWLPEPGDAAQYDIIRAENLRPKVINSFLAESATIGRQITYPGYVPVNDSLAWSFDPTFLASDAESPDITLASIFTTSLQVTNGSAATALSTIINILASMAYYDQFPNFAETAHDVSTTYFQPFLFPQSFRGFTAVLVITVVHFLLVVIITAAFITSTRLTTLGDHWQTISQSVSPATEEILQNSSCSTDKEVRQGLEEEHREHEMANLQPLAGGAGRIGVVIARKRHRRSSYDMRLE